MCTTCKHVHISRRHESLARAHYVVLSQHVEAKALQQLFQLNGKSAETED